MNQLNAIIATAILSMCALTEGQTGVCMEIEAS